VNAHGLDLETDYLMVGAGAAGMVFTEQLLAHSDATVTIVDRRHAPGGHWVDAYPFVRLHQPSAFYGLSSMSLGQSAIDSSGTNAGYYELAGRDEICAHFERAMHRHFLPTGRVQYLPNCDYVGEHRVVSRLTGSTHQFQVRRKVVDTSYLEPAIPATTRPPFEVADGVACVPIGALARLDERPERYAVIGGGKTALDACVWLLEQGVPPDRICWLKPREAWWINRHFQQPLTLAPEFHRGSALQFEAMAEADTIDDVFARLEGDGYFLRVDQDVVPTMFRGAVVSEGELALLRRIEDVVRLGRVRRIERDQIVLEDGSVPTTTDTLHIHCAAGALPRRPLRPIFEPGLLTMQPFAWSFACYLFGTLGVVEATVESDEDKNAMCSPIPYWDQNVDFLSSVLMTLGGERTRRRHPIIGEWMSTTRLNPFNATSSDHDDPVVIESRERIRKLAPHAVANLQRLVAQGATG
jgi:hypothetical protein